MASVILSNRQRIDLENFMLHAPSARECCRAQAVLWLAEGETADQVAERLHVSRQTVYNRAGDKTISEYVSLILERQVPDHRTIRIDSKDEGP